MSHLLALDQGTSSSRSIVFRTDGSIVAMAQRELSQIYPAPGWVEHDPMEIWTSQLATAQEVLKRAGIRPSEVKAIGITNQRETTIVWNRRTGVPIANALVWQDRRTELLCSTLRRQGHEAMVQSLTGLRIDPYFSASKLKWMLDEVHGARAAAERGELIFGTVDAWLLWQLTEGRVHATDVSNASRTMLYNIHTGDWDDRLLTLFNIPRQMLPQVLPSSSHFGDTNLLGHPLPIGGMAGDQQCALFGQACFKAGLAKSTYGTGCFLLMHTGHQAQSSRNGLLTTAAAQAPGQPASFAMEGSVFVGGAVVQWLRDGLQAIKTSGEVEQLAQSVPDANGVVVVPAFTGLGAPYWNANAKGAIVGLSRGTTLAHIARAALESIAYQSTALLQAMNRDAVQLGGTVISELRVDGGASANNLLMQMQADLLGIPVVRPSIIETSALGAAYLAGLSAGVYQDLQQLERNWAVDRVFFPVISHLEAGERMHRWEHAVRQTVAC